MRQIAQFAPSFDKADADAVRRVVESGWVSAGPKVREFEERIAKIQGYKFGVATNSGTTALTLALMATGLKPNSLTFVSDLTFIGTANSVYAAGGVPVFMDIKNRDFNMDCIRVRPLTFSSTFVPTHLNGRDAGYADVSDAAQTVGSKISKSLVASLSFAPPKIITTGYGGMLLTDDPTIAEKAKRLTNHGRLDGSDEHPSIGFNWRMTDMQAALGLSQLDKLPERINHKRMICAQYQEELEGLSLRIGKARKGELLLNQDILVENRDRLMGRLAKLGIETRPFYKPLHTQPAYKTSESFPVAERVSATGLWLPSGPGLTTEEVSFVCKSIKECLRWFC